MLKSKRWPWLTDGWEVVEEVQGEEFARNLSAGNDLPKFFDLGYVYSPYIPCDLTSEQSLFLR